MFIFWLRWYNDTYLFKKPLEVLKSYIDIKAGEINCTHLPIINSKNSYVQGYLLQLMGKVVAFIEVSNRNWSNIKTHITAVCKVHLFTLGFSSKCYLLVYISKTDNHLCLPLFMALMTTMFVKCFELFVLGVLFSCFNYCSLT